MRVGDVSRARRFANPARLRWYAFHRSVRFALRMMKAEESASPAVLQLPLIDLPVDIDPCLEPAPGPDLNEEDAKQPQIQPASNTEGNRKEDLGDWLFPC